MQEFLKTVLNKTKVILLLLACCGFNSFAQQTTDIALTLSVEPQTIYPGQQGIITFTATNNGVMTNVFGEPQAVLQANGALDLANIIIDSNYLEGECSANVDLVPLDKRAILLYFFDLGAHSSAICKVRFTIPNDISENFVVFGYELKTYSFTDSNLSNNTASVRINIKKRVRSVPVMNIWGSFALLLALMIAARQRYKKGI